jgi:hypothetical protein
MTLKEKKAILRACHYRLGVAEELLSSTKQPRAKDYEGFWLIDDPESDEDGFVLRGDDYAALIDEATEFLELGGGVL